MMQFDKRRARLLKLVRQAGADGILVSNLTNVTYLTGFTGDSSHLLITPRETVLVSDFRYITQIEEECPDLPTHIRPSTTLLRDAVIEVIGKTKVQRLAIEGDSFTIADYNHVREQLPRLEVLVSSGLVEGLRQIKDKEEIAQLREAVRMAERSFAVLRATLRPKGPKRNWPTTWSISCGLKGRSRAVFRRSSPRAHEPPSRMPGLPTKRSQTKTCCSSTGVRAPRATRAT
jgi:Xaa-Pro aminopeptidase